MSAAGQVEAIRTGQILKVGDFVFEVMLIPGHSPGHISLVERKRRILLAGDLVGKGPAWYTPTSGGVTTYLNSLAKLKALDADSILPSHGPIIRSTSAAIDKIENKLLASESLLRDLLTEGVKSFKELTQALFQSPPFHFLPGCAIMESHLIKLKGESVIKTKRYRIILV
jgi:glyoxylase-like metal-dependent hydrolase (beta-lactamase superfamily II)